MKKNLRLFLWFLISYGLVGSAVISFAQTVGFSAPTNFAVGNNPRSVVVGDFNGDGKQDLAVANHGNGNVSILLGNDNGSFGAPTNFAVGSDPQSVAVGDFNGDGKQDLAVANWASGNVSILLGNGNGIFNAPTNFAVGSNPESVAVGDFNGDGKQDLAVANNAAGNISILLGDGAGSFGSATNFTAGGDTHSVAVGDFNGDGKQDLAVANGINNNVSILLGNGAGSFGAPTHFATGGYPLEVAVGDFNGDGKQDLAVVNYFSSNVSILLGNGDGSFGSTTHFTAGGDTYSVAVGDFNGDGKQDLAVANGAYRNVSILLGNGDGSFNAPTNFATGGDAYSVAVGDFNGDGKQDLAVVNYYSNDVSILLNVPAISIGDVAISEGNAGTVNASFQVYLSEPSTQTVSVTFSIENGTATAGSDYVATSGTVTFNPGETVKTITVVVNGDTLNEADETFLVNLSNPVNAAIGDGQGVGTIVNDDSIQAAPYFPIESGNFWTSQGDGASVTRTVLPGVVTINGLATKALADDNGFVQYFSNDSAGVRLHRQYQPNVDIGLGFPVNLELTFSPPVVFANATMTLGQTLESGGTAQTNNLPVVGVLTFGYSASFTLQGFETVTVPAGSFAALKLQGYLNVGGEIVYDTIYLVQNLGMVKLIEVSAGITTTAELLSTNVVAPTVAVSAPDPSATEAGPTTGTFAFTRTGPTTSELTVTYTVSGTATSGSDYSGLSGILIIPAGASSATLVVTPNDDTLVEGTETVIVTLAESPNYSLGTPNSATITIADNDLPAVSINNVTVTEGIVGTVNAVFSVGLSAAGSEAVTVSYSTANGTATAGTDYIAQSGTLTFNPGETTKNITILVNGDTALEPNETFLVNLTSASNATLGIGQGVGTIVNDDFPLAVTAFHPTPSGFDVDFNKPINVSVLNLYDNEAHLFGPADVTIVGAATGPVRGSLVVDGPAGAITFVKTHGVLEPDTYTVTLRSADNGFKDTDGNLLDGDGDGAPGGDFVTNFAVTPTNSVIVSVPDFVVGPGQAVNVPFNRGGLPILLTGGADVTNLEFTLLYNPDLLMIDTVTSGEALPADATVQVNSALPGALTLRVGSPTGLGASPIELARLTASVPDTAVYRSTQVLSFEIASVTPTTPGAKSADAVHVVAYIGDTTGNAAYNSLDAQRVLRVVVGLDSGFTAYPLIDPLLIGDASWNRVLNSLDATRILQEVVGLDRLEIPPIPQK